MKLIHTGDVHLGMEAEPCLFPRCYRGREIWEGFYRVIDKCNQEKIDFLLIAGDLFHYQPTRDMLEEVNEKFASLFTTRVILIAGNHDHLIQDSIYERFVWASNVYFLKSAKGESIYFPKERVTFYGASYWAEQYKENIYKDIYPHKEDGYHILVAHGGDSLHSPLIPEHLSAKGFDYVALGHIHKPCVCERERFAYPGSLVPLHKNEEGRGGYLYIRLDKRRIFVQRFYVQEREYKRIKIHVVPTTSYEQLEEAIMQGINREGKDNIFVIDLCGKLSPLLEKTYTSLKEIGLICQISYSHQEATSKRGGILADAYAYLQGQEEIEDKQKDRVYQLLARVLERKGR